MIISAPRAQQFTYVIQGLFNADYELVEWPILYYGDFFVSADSKMWCPMQRWAGTFPDGIRVGLKFTTEEMSSPLVFVKGQSQAEKWIDFHLLIVTRQKRAGLRNRRTRRD